MDSLLLGPLVGGLSHHSANIWARASGPGRLHAWLGHDSHLSDARLAGESLPLSQETSFAGVAPVHGLNPDTRYYYALTLDTAPPQVSPDPYPYFTTFPSPGERYPFAFAFGSCFRPQDEEGGAIFTALDEIKERENLRFLLLLGDQIYADAWQNNGLGTIACTLDDYRRAYEYAWRRPPLRQLLADIPVFMTLDDHEVDDDWTWTDHHRHKARIPVWNRVIRWFKRRRPEARSISRKRVQNALQAYWEHQGMHAPAHLRPLQLAAGDQYALETGDPGSLAYTFNFGGAAFFVLDTRTMRIKSRGERSMLGQEQWQALETWLLDVKEAYPVKFIITSAALLFNMWIDLARDRWSGFPRERDRLLHFLAAHGIQGVHLLAGDLHSSHALRAELYGPDQTALPVWEFCSSPFLQASNWLARRTYTPLRSGPVRSQELHFIVTQPNFGVVRVDYDLNEDPRVRFEVHGENGELLKEIG